MSPIDVSHLIVVSDQENYIHLMMAKAFMWQRENPPPLQVDLSINDSKGLEWIY